MRDPAKVTDRAQVCQRICNELKRRDIEFLTRLARLISRASSPVRAIDTASIINSTLALELSLENHDLHIHQIHFLVLKKNGIAVARTSSQLRARVIVCIQTHSLKRLRRFQGGVAHSVWRRRWRPTP